MEWLARKFFDIEDWLFEKITGLDFSGQVSVSDLGLASSSRPYHTVWTRNLRSLIREAVKVGKFPMFVDLGCGKGKACFYARRRFDRVIGVELSTSLIEAARRNVSMSGASNIEIEQDDAAKYILPDIPALVFMFNPFDGSILKSFMANNLDNFKRNGSVIAYANDKHRDVLIEMGLREIYRESGRQISLRGFKFEVQRLT